ncbi:hypothetical protein CYY_002931 [Polysphondylium violaceum]|uniref:Uncharacterized protein n=1 Tax=Polysphondylium violaceum TaxID=133409 RepID=A0A8J4V959_9MYCE|nr:hypothetical protein CYY_002931 [Polysphondylium violaceum]
MGDHPTLFGTEKFEPEEYQNIANFCSTPIPETELTSRKGNGNMNFAYIEGWKSINVANEAFGFNGWSSSIKILEVDFDEMISPGRYMISVTAIVRVTLKNGTYHEDVGMGSGDGPRAAALEKAKKEAVTDSLKRVLRLFGDAFGNYLYDKDTNREVSKSITASKTAAKPAAQQASKPAPQQQQISKPAPQQQPISKPAPQPQQQQQLQQNQQQQQQPQVKQEDDDDFNF